MGKAVLVFILTFIGGFVLLSGLVSIVGGDDTEDVYVLLFVIQFSFINSILVQILYRVRALEKRDK